MAGPVPPGKATATGKLEATILHCLDIDHERLIVKHQGLAVRTQGSGRSARRSMLATSTTTTLMPDCSVDNRETRQPDASPPSTCEIEGLVERRTQRARLHAVGLRIEAPGVGGSALESVYGTGFRYQVAASVKSTRVPRPVPTYATRRYRRIPGSRRTCQASRVRGSFPDMKSR